MIPKKIHFFHNHDFLLDNTTKTYRDREYFDTWAIACPDYEIIHWHDELPEFQEMLKRSRYMSDCYKRKIWAIVSDCLRVYVLYHYGGIWLDTDVRVFRSFDSLLNEKCFFAAFAPNQFEKKIDFLVEPCIMGSEKHGYFIKNLLDIYESDIWYHKNIITIYEMTTQLFYNTYEKSDNLKKRGEDSIAVGSFYMPSLQNETFHTSDGEVTLFYNDIIAPLGGDTPGLIAGHFPENTEAPTEWKSKYSLLFLVHKNHKILKFVETFPHLYFFCKKTAKIIKQSLIKLFPRLHKLYRRLKGLG